MKEFIPVNAPYGAQDKVTVKALFTYDNASPSLSGTYFHTDLTTVGNPVQPSGLTLVKSVDKSTALPGEVITYTITFTNVTSDVLSSVVVYDSTPAYTTFGGASYDTLPQNLTGVTQVNPSAGGTGPIRWTFDGTLKPGASGTVYFWVTVNP
jgi:uncharacterized repeat protein (TIGR01451 family)